MRAHRPGRLAVLCFAALLGAAAAADFGPEVDKIVKPLVEKQKLVGVSIGIVTPEGTQTHNYGAVSRQSDKCPDADTLYEIGSITKTFTATLLADMAREGLVKLDDPVRIHLPDDVKVPARNGREITLLDLAAHRSGLPRMPNNMLLANLLSPHDPYADYTPEKSYAFLRKHDLRRDIGAEYEYSNFGAGLLGLALARRAGMSYNDLVVRRICKPLGMNDTCTSLTETQRSRLAQGHSAFRQPAASWNFQDTFAGAGALRSSVNDMLLYIKANAGLQETSLYPAMQRCHEVRIKTETPDLAVGMGWHIWNPGNPEEEIIWHNGGTGGYRTWAGFNRKTKSGVVVLTNIQKDHSDEIGMRILQDHVIREGAPVAGR